MPHFRLSLVLLLAGLWSLSARAAADPPDFRDSNSIFSGLILNLIIEGQRCPVVDFVGEEYVILRGDAQVSLPASTPLSAQPAPKFSTHAIQVEELAVAPFASARAATIDAYNDLQSLLAAERPRPGDLPVEDASPAPAPSLASPDAPQPAPAPDHLQLLRQELARLEEKLREDGDSVDSLRISGLLFPSRDYERVFVLILARYHLIGESAKKLKNNLFAKDLGPLRKNQGTALQVRMGGFPPGFVIREIHYHFFSGRDEIPSNLSSQRLLMSDDEAFDYLLTRHLARAGRSSSRPILFKHLPRGDFLALTGPAAPDSLRVTLTISTDGRSTVDRLEGASSSTQGDLHAFFSQARFLPALENGQPVSRTITLPLASLLD